ncbi:hypothetical protein FACS1894187_26110 [Synergistales bacterium]|nr:hypothetical protein FACS1894187_26110 [Synergistales bacterium]
MQLGISGKTVTLAKALDLANHEWTSIGWNGAFSGIFDGGGYEISNLTISTIANGGGLFGRVSYGTLKNVRLTGVNMSGVRESGSLVYAVDDSNITNCSAIGSITGSGCGGLIGSVYGGFGFSTVAKSSANVNVTGGSSAGFIGIVSVSDEDVVRVTVINCHASGKVTGSSSAGFISLIVPPDQYYYPGYLRVMITGNTYDKRGTGQAYGIGADPRGRYTGTPIYNPSNNGATPK